MCPAAPVGLDINNLSGSKLTKTTLMSLNISGRMFRKLKFRKDEELKTTQIKSTKKIWKMQKCCKGILKM